MVKIGFLFPYSGVFPTLKDDFRQGFELALAEAAPGLKFSVFGEFIQMGDFNSVEQALNKLLYFERVDLAVGIVENVVVKECLPAIEKHGIPVIINNLGASVPRAFLSGTSLFYNGFHLWKSEWAIGKWAQQAYGGQPAISLSIYEAGYHMHDCFRTGAGAGGAENVTLNVLKDASGKGDVAPLLDFLETQRPRHSHALLSGREATDFLAGFQARGFKDTMALTVHPFFCTDGKEEDLVYASTWTSDLESEKNSHFRAKYQKHYEAEPHAFCLLGYESGLAAGTALANMEGKLTHEKLRNALYTASPLGPRGAIHLSTRPLEAFQPVYLCRDGRVEEELPAVHWDDPMFLCADASISGWMNPYLCV